MAGNAAKRVAEQSLGKTVFQVLANPRLRKAGIGCVFSIFYNFFFLQYKAAFLPGRIPVSPVDHPLDRSIPFTPKWVGVYLDFVAFWVRIIGFILDQYGRRGIPPLEAFIQSMGKLYTFAAEVYTQNLSTTKRPRYLARPRFLLIHAADPHLMCIPSLHVMVVIRTYTQFRFILRSLGGEEKFAPQIEEVRRGAQDITEAILYVKQHSVNCVSAAMYGMSRFDPPLFPPEEAESFIAGLFVSPGSPPEQAAIRAHIGSLYQRFLAEGEGASHWRDPLLSFLRKLPRAGP